MARETSRIAARLRAPQLAHGLSAVGLNVMTFCHSVVVGPDGQGAGKVLVVIGDCKLRALGHPGRRDAAAADDTTRLDLENVGESPSNCDFQIEAHRLGAVIRQVNVLLMKGPVASS